MMHKARAILIVPGFMVLLGSLTTAQESVSNKYFSLHFGPAGITSLRRSPQFPEQDFIMQGETLGNIHVRYRMLNQDWQDFMTAGMTDACTIKQGAETSASQQVIVYNGSGWYDYYADLEFTNRLRLEGNVLYWTLHFRNVTHKPIEIGDFLLLLPFNTAETLNMVSFIAGHGSFIHWKPKQSESPYLVMMPVEKCPLFEPAQTERNFAPASLEYKDEKGVYIHAALSGAVGDQDWDIPRSNHILTPKFTPGDEITYAFKFRWADDEEDLHRILYEEGLFDLDIQPGTALSRDESATISLRSKNKVESITAEYPDQTGIEDLGEKRKDEHIFRVKFSRRGENLLTFRYSGGRKMFLRFAVKEDTPISPSGSDMEEL